MVIVAVLLVNLLIAMMGNTYTMIAETKNEWQRQWARIVLVVERGVPPSERLKNFMAYSQPMSDGRRALVLRLNMTVIINLWSDAHRLLLYSITITIYCHNRTKTRKR